MDANKIAEKNIQILGKFLFPFNQNGLEVALHHFNTWRTLIK